MERTTYTREEWDSMTPDEQFQHVNFVLLPAQDELRRLLQLIPQCPIHGECIPYAAAWIRRQLWRIEPPATHLD